MQAQHLFWFISLKSSIVRCLLNAVVKVPRNCWERTSNFWNDTFFSFSSNYSLIPFFLNKNKNENREYYGTFMYSKVISTQNKGVPFFSCLVQRLHENGDWLLCFSNEAKWFSVRLQTKRLWNQFLLQLLKLQMWHACDMIRTHS